MSIKTKTILLASIALVAIAVTVVLLVFATVNIRRINEKRRLAIDLTENIADLDSDVLDLALTPGALGRAAIEDDLEKIDRSIENMRSGFDQASHKRLLGSIHDSNERLDALVDRLDRASEEAGAPAAMTSGTQMATVHAILNETRAMLRATDSLRVLTVDELQRAERAETVISIILLVVISASLVGISVLVFRSVTRPILELDKGTKIVAAGDLDHKIDYDRKDEIGDLARSFNAMALQLKESFGALEAEIEERKRVEAELQEKNVELEGFAQTVSHDIKSPVATIGFAAHTLNAVVGQEPTEETRARILEITQMINSAVESVSVLIDDMLALAQAGREPTDIGEVDVRETVEKVLSENRWAIERKDINVRVDEDLGTIRANAVQVYQVFVNLITNSIKYNDNPEPVIEVSYLGRDDEAGHRYVVRDNGSGIPESDLENVFTPFFKGRRGGTGIGLATVAKTITVYGGAIKAYNRAGARFEFNIKDR